MTSQKSLTHRRVFKCAGYLMVIITSFCLTSCAQDTPNDLPGKFLELHNKLRAQNSQCAGQSVSKTHQLKWSEELASAALEHSLWLAQQQKLSHTNENGESLGTRLTQAGYAWREVAENLAKTDQAEESVIQMWLQSKHHCLNMFRPGISEMGAATVDGYWTAIYGRPAQ